MICDFETVEIDGKYQHKCRNCGYSILASAKSLTRRCTTLPPVGQQLKTVTLATLKWVAAGRPERTAEEIDAILAVCKTCEHFTGSRCKLCGCWLRAKAKMATESCPDGRW